MFFIFVGGRAVIVGVGCGVVVVVGSVVVFSELERDEQGMGVLTSVRRSSLQD
jgi:ABC-type branched-subunit amino acid transport system permease subunit